MIINCNNLLYYFIIIHTILFRFIYSDPIIPEDVEDPSEESEGEMASTSAEAGIGARVTRMREVVGKKVLNNIRSAQTRQKKHFDKRRVQQQVWISDPV
jgi:hypothetical protein